MKFSLKKKTLKNTGQWEKKYWKSQGNLSVRKIGNHVSAIYVHVHPTGVG